MPRPCSQDTVLTVPPYLFVLDDPTDVPLEESWFAWPQLCFTCYHLRSRDGKSPIGCRTYGEDDIAVQMMFYSFFEVLDLPCSGPMETSSRCEVVKDLSNAHSPCGPRLKCAGASALDALVSPQKLYAAHPALIP